MNLFQFTNPQSDFTSSALAGKTLSSTSTTTSGGANINPVKLGPMPKAPDYAKLEDIGGLDELHAAMDASSKTYDDIYASTEAQGNQSAQNAGNIYAGRLMQAGINPVAQGVVQAQAKLPVLKELASIKSNQAQAKVDQEYKAQTLAAQVATTIANLKMQYTQSLADYNYKGAQIGLGNNQNAIDNAKLTTSNSQFQQSFGLDQQKLGIAKSQLELDRQKTDAAVAASRAATTAQNQANRSIVSIIQQPNGRVVRYSDGTSQFFALQGNTSVGPAHI